MEKLPKSSILMFRAPLKGVFCANFIPYPKGQNVKDTIGQFWNIEIFALWNGGLQRRKNGHFDHFGQNCIVALL